MDNLNFKMLRGAVKEGLNRVKGTVGGELDQDLAIYERLTSENLNSISSKYGMDNTIKYIKAMEQKRLGNNGKPK